MKDPYKRASLKKYGWSMEDISKTPMRRRWKKTWKRAARAAVQREVRQG